MYQNVQYDKGHLVPGATYSKTQQRFDSTYTYTNAVPQHNTFNGGKWSQFEKRIRKYAEKTCIKQLRVMMRGKLQLLRPGTLYLLTGTSFARIQELQNGDPQGYFPVGANQIGTIDTGKIFVPNSLWTAGCCVRQNGQFTRSFAVMGNNVETFHRNFLTRQITVAQLQTILTADVNHFQLNNNIGGHNVDLFPADQNCLNNDLGVLPNAGVGR